MARPAIQCQATLSYHGARCPNRKLPGRDFCLRHEVALNGTDGGEDELYNDPMPKLRDLMEEDPHWRPTGT